MSATHIVVHRHLAFCRLPRRFRIKPFSRYLMERGSARSTTPSHHSRYRIHCLKPSSRYSLVSTRVKWKGSFANAYSIIIVHHCSAIVYLKPSHPVISSIQALFNGINPRLLDTVTIVVSSKFVAIPS